MYQRHRVTQLHRSGAEGRQAPHQGWGNRVISEDYFHLKTNIQFSDHSIQISLVPSLCLPKSTYVFLAYFSFSCPSFPYFIHCSFLEVWILMSISAHFITCYPTPFRSCLWQFGSFLLSVCHPGTQSFIEPCKPAAAEGIVSHGKQRVRAHWTQLWWGPGARSPELPARWWKDTTHLTLSPCYTNFLGPVQLVISKGAVKCWIETLLKSLWVSLVSFRRVGSGPGNAFVCFSLVISLPLAESYNPFREDLFICENSSIAVKR